MGKLIWALQKTKKRKEKCEHTHTLINMNHKMACYGRPCLQGVLAQAKNGDELFCERNFIQPMGPMGRPKHALKVLCFLKKRFGWRGGFFSILHLVTNVFP
jgi:hypothetical protein